MAFSNASRVMMREGCSSSRDHSTIAAPAQFGDGIAARIGRGNVGAARQGHAQRLGQAGHGGGGAHHGAMAGAAGDAAFDLAPFFLAEPAGAVQVEQLAAVGAGAQVAGLATGRPASARRARRWRECRRWRRPSAARAWSCRSRTAARRRRGDWRGWIPPRPSPSGCETAWWWGAMNISPSEMVGNSSGTPPAAQTPRFTAVGHVAQMQHCNCSARSRNCRCR